MRLVSLRVLGKWKQDDQLKDSFGSRPWFTPLIPALRRRGRWISFKFEAGLVLDKVSPRQPGHCYKTKQTFNRAREMAQHKKALATNTADLRFIP